MEYIKECGKYKLFFKTFWLAVNRPISAFNLFAFLLYVTLTLITVTYTLESTLILFFDMRLNLLILAIALFVVGAIVNVGMYFYVDWFHKKGIYKYIEYDEKKFEGTFLKDLISVL
ncbi:hypothetical protein [Staphylococcus aureus]|uniref:hypothetical protein n=1 Tax=Staphylococcus aureus TaxID=1280 RepID=UPI00044A68FC|nr:hypothetical protein [Staphylococcus aureus]EZX75056.1 hypothetical protein V110_02646 [Staphylococcus aureus Chi-8]HDE8373977.1 hypothetical protein [Staphylococcus aureus]HDG4884464.1 hypothetical protein [Staphylococcus aureus]HDK3864936.1 hypothetical protein [Staphylococcus aureus]HEO8862708.1 hypothetical protein [Staphylococcus aureus]